MTRSRGEAGFTLIEVIGAFFLMTVILIFVTGIFFENGRQREAASELMRVETTAAAALDLIAQDLEATIYLAPRRGASRRDHPWIFEADRAGELGATYLRFQTQNVPRGHLGEHASTWVDVAYFLEEDVEQEDRFTLWRWRSTRPPGLAGDPDLDVDDPRSARIARGIADFGVTFLDAEGGSRDEWSSPDESQETPLPIGAEISLALYREARPGEAEGDELEIATRPRVRSVTLPMHRPVDIDALIEIALALETGGSCATVDDCLQLSENQWYTSLLQDDCDGDSELCDLLSAPGVTCWDDIAQGWPEIAGQADPACEALR